MATVRTLLRKDIPGLLKMAEPFFEQSGFPGKFSLHRAHETLLTCIASASRGCLVLVDDNEKPLGALGFEISRLWFSSSVVARELFFWIDPDSRGGHGSAMLEAFEAAAKARGAEFTVMVALAASNYDRVTDFYRYKSYRAMESAFIKELS